MSKLPLTSYSMPSATWNLAPSYLSSFLSVFLLPWEHWDRCSFHPKTLCVSTSPCFPSASAFGVYLPSEAYSVNFRAWSVAQLCLIFVTPGDTSPPGSSVHEILQARMLKWVTISFSRGSPQPRDWTWVSCISCIVRWVLYHWAT